MIESLSDGKSRASRGEEGSMARSRSGAVSGYVAGYLTVRRSVANGLSAQGNWYKLENFDFHLRGVGSSSSSSSVSSTYPGGVSKGIRIRIVSSSITVVQNGESQFP